MGSEHTCGKRVHFPFRASCWRSVISAAGWSGVLSYDTWPLTGSTCRVATIKVYQSGQLFCSGPGPLGADPRRGPADARGEASPTTPVPRGPVPRSTGTYIQVRIRSGNQEGDHWEIELGGAGRRRLAGTPGKSGPAGCELRSLEFPGSPKTTGPGKPAASPGT